MVQINNTDINIKIKNSDKMLLTSDDWQLLFLDDLSLSDAEAKREWAERKHNDFAVDILSIYNRDATKQALFALRYVINLTNSGHIEAKDVYDGQHPLVVGDKSVDARALNFLYWPLQKTMKTALDERLQMISAGWMIIKYRRNTKENKKLLEKSKNDLTNFLDSHFTDLISNIS